MDLRSGFRPTGDTTQKAGFKLVIRVSTDTRNAPFRQAQSESGNFASTSGVLPKYYVLIGRVETIDDLLAFAL